jgi:hypothetical protein
MLLKVVRVAVVVVVSWMQMQFLFSVHLARLL